MTPVVNRVAAHRERQKAEGLKTVSITMTADTHRALKDARESTGKTYQQIIEEALRFPNINGEHLVFLQALADQRGESIRDVLAGIIQAAWEDLKARWEDPLNPEHTLDPLDDF